MNNEIVKSTYYIGDKNDKMSINTYIRDTGKKKKNENERKETNGGVGLG